MRWGGDIFVHKMYEPKLLFNGEPITVARDNLYSGTFTQVHNYQKVFSIISFLFLISIASNKSSVASIEN